MTEKVSHTQRVLVIGRGTAEGVVSSVERRVIQKSEEDLQREAGASLVEVLGEREILLLPLKMLRFDHTYQRPLTALVATITADFRWELFGLPLVNQRSPGDVCFFVIDGQQRITGLRGVLKGQECLIACQVVRGRSVQEEAEAARRLNTSAGRINATPLEVWTMSVEAKEPITLSIKAVLDALDLHIGKTAGIQCIRSPRALYNVYGANRKELLRDVLVTMQQAWGHLTDGRQEEVWQARLIGGIAAFMTRYGKYPQYDQAFLIRQLHRMTPTTVLAAAKSVRVREPWKTPDAAISMTVQAIYDRNIRRNNEKRLVPKEQDNG